MVKCVIVCEDKDYTTKKYFDTLEHAQQYVKEYELGKLAKFWGIFEMRPNTKGEYDIIECIEAW